MAAIVLYQAYALVSTEPDRAPHDAGKREYRRAVEWVPDWRERTSITSLVGHTDCNQCTNQRRPTNAQKDNK